MGTWCRLYFFHPTYNKDLFRKKYNITAKHILSYVGRLAPEKDIDTLQTLIQTTNKERDDIHWLIAGDGPLATNLREAVPKTNVTFTGYLQGTDLAEAYACSHMMVFPSVLKRSEMSYLNHLHAVHLSLVQIVAELKILLQMEKQEFFAHPNMQFILIIHPFFITK